MLVYKIAGKETVQEQIKLYNTVFDEHASLPGWLKKHYENPATTEEKLYGAFDNEKLVGINGFLEMCYVYGEQKFKAIQSCDTAVSPEYRGRGIFTKIVMNAEEEFKKQGYDLMIGYPNFNSYPGFLKMGWMEMARTKKYFLPTNMQNMVKHMKGLKLTKASNVFTWFMWRNIRKEAKKAEGINLKVNDTITSDEYSRYIDKSYLYFKLDDLLMKWKLEDLVGSYTGYKDNEEICKFVVCQYDFGDEMKGANIILADCPEKYAREYRCVLARILLDIKSRFDLICIWEPRSIDKQRSIKKLGFLNNIAAKEGNPFIIKILTDDPAKTEILSNKEYWNPQQIETDTMINLNKGYGV